MKKSIFIWTLAGAFIGSAFFLSSCGGSSEKSNETEQHEHMNGEDHDHDHGDMDNHDMDNMDMDNMDMDNMDMDSTMHSSNESGKVYYCPMHPDQTADHEGQCPECGMNMKLKES